MVTVQGMVKRGTKVFKVAGGSRRPSNLVTLGSAVVKIKLGGRGGAKRVLEWSALAVEVIMKGQRS